jgi:ABC-2 type transport system ATP-binding protein
VNAIEVQGLTRRFGDFTAVDAVSFEVKQREIFGYLGANGAGKSTTIRMLCGLLMPTDGVARVAGIDVLADPEGVKRSIGYMSQRFSLYMDLHVRENLEFFGGAYGVPFKRLNERIELCLERVGLADEADTMTGALPGGTRQRVALASALLHEPKILFLDEPTAGVDPESRRRFWRLIRDLAATGTTIFVTTHYMDEAEYCDRIGLMVDGKLVALDTPAGLKAEYVPGALVRFDGPDVRRSIRTWAAQDGVIEAHPFGAGVHIRYDPNLTNPDRLQAVVGGALTRKAVDATLEDVFLAVAG